MPLLPILALLEHPGGSAVDEMLRLFGIAAIVFACFKGIKSLVTKPAAPAGSQAPLAARSTPPAPPAAIAPEILAAIAAAVATTSGPSGRIVAIKQHSSHWEKAGRQLVLTSHRIR